MDRFELTKEKIQSMLKHPSICNEDMRYTLGLLLSYMNGLDNEWKSYSEEKPPYGVEVLAYHHKWVDEDFNPDGIRIGFLQDNLAEDSETNPYDFTSAYWWNYQDCYTTINKFECLNDDKSKSFYRHHIDNIEPEFWREIPKFEKREMPKIKK